MEARAAQQQKPSKTPEQELQEAVEQLRKVTEEATRKLDAAIKDLQEAMKKLEEMPGVPQPQRRPPARR